ncbi:hypothetical protein L2E82_25544 [Cichorium intybus]|uniref:Uncharacterized protein n=1 Tax=Cichorium intybus TaxID=13427 RepID=A0ACB9E482_CICIN|nr:hypothetical protein L2E82_25544 [Cichorium intybus]
MILNAGAPHENITRIDDLDSDLSRMSKCMLVHHRTRFYHLRKMMRPWRLIDVERMNINFPILPVLEVSEHLISIFPFITDQFINVSSPSPVIPKFLFLLFSDKSIPLNYSLDQTLVFTILHSTEY